MDKDYAYRYSSTVIILINYILLVRFLFVVICPVWQVLRKHLYKVLPRETVDSMEYSDLTVQDLHVFIKKKKKHPDTS